ncbi:hypothetical protein [Nocardia sp. NPDC049707]|uniref:hypothetical protein n=1 Tax=Nocardia sp. NPDC049707 TaxID=3154735 RepID=UPI003414ECF5
MLTVVATAVLVLAAGCSSSPPVATPVSSQAQPTMTQGQLCDLLKNFFTTELHAVEVRSIPIVSTDLVLKWSGGCSLAQGQNPIGNYQVENAPDDADPTWGRRGFVKQPELGEAVWVYDLRTDRSNRVRFATRINQWNAILEISDTETQTDKGDLHLTDDDKRKSVQFLTELTKKFAVD